jgi:hypothetical protein
MTDVTILKIFPQKNLTKQIWKCLLKYRWFMQNIDHNFDFDEKMLLTT